jgi:hypothetical protein
VKLTTLPGRLQMRNRHAVLADRIRLPKNELKQIQRNKLPLACNIQCLKRFEFKLN